MDDLRPRENLIDYIPIDHFLQDSNENKTKPKKKKNTEELEKIIEKINSLEEKNRFLENQLLELKMNSHELVQVMLKIKETLDKYLVEDTDS